MCTQAEAVCPSGLTGVGGLVDCGLECYEQSITETNC